MPYPFNLNKYISLLGKKKLTIFLFHGVVERQMWSLRNYTRKHLLKNDFLVFLRAMKDAGCALSMDDVLEHLERGIPFPDHSFAITFDDGFENNYSIAAPVLNDFSIPAIFYITTGYIGTDQMSWPDSIESCLEKVNTGSLVFPWSAQQWTLSSVAEKIRVMDYLRSYVKKSPEIDTSALVDLVSKQCGNVSIRKEDGHLDKKMNWEQVQKLAANKLFLIGGHSHSHRIMAFLSDKELEKEIGLSMEELKKHVGHNNIHYSYPEGLAHCYDERVIVCLKRYGIRCSPSAVEGTNDERESPFHLKRVFVV